MVIYIGPEDPGFRRWVPRDRLALENFAEFMVPSIVIPSPLETTSGTFVDPYSGEQVIVRRHSPDRVKFLEGLNIESNRPSLITLDLPPRKPTKVWAYNNGTLGFTRRVSIPTNDPDASNYFIYVGPDRSLYDRLFILQENTKGKYAFVKDLFTNSLYSIDKKFLSRPEVDWVGPSNGKKYRTSSWSGYYRNKRGELSTKGFKVLRTKEPLDTSRYHIQGKATSVLRVSRGSD